MEGATPNILLVDDRPDKLLALEAALDDLPLRVVRAESGAEALRHVLTTDFAVILLDVNMPGMDGFETAQLIRQRRNSAHTPIIFLTAMSDEMYVERGYSLGAVDYLLSPVVPAVLRSKVIVFVDLFGKTQQVRQQAERLHQRAAQLHRLTDASLAINSAATIEKVAEIVTETARDVIGCHQAITLAAPSHLPAHSISHVSYSPKYARWSGKPLNIAGLSAALAHATGHNLKRFTRAEFDSRIVLQGGGDGPGMQGLLTVPLRSRDGRTMGSIYLSDRIVGDFTDDDQAIVVQLAQMASVAMENIVFAQERQANRFKDEFLATLSHELRTPLNAISGWVQLLRLNPINGDLGHGLDVIERNVKSQTRLIEDLLDLSRISNGQLRIQKRVVALQPLLQGVIEAMRPAVESHRLYLKAELDCGDSVLGDPERLQQVFSNLLTNSVKFTPSGGTITVRLGRENEDLCTSIIDTGEGIDAEFLPRVFDRFRQAETGSARRHGGLGIGLTIVRYIAELHGGTVAAHSAGKGRGSTFTVKLPLAVMPQMTHVSAPDDDGTKSLVSLGGIRILLVDDDADAREVIGQLLQRRQATVTTAASAVEALEKFSGQAPDILVTDLAMPDRDGFALLSDVRKLPAGQRHIPAIALTAYARREDEERTRSAGFQAHVAKPVNPNDLVSAIQRCVHTSASGLVAADPVLSP
jgi:signal transduction histidine kinase/DNA-binding response OmpR family regulator